MEPKPHALPPNSIDNEFFGSCSESDLCENDINDDNKQKKPSMYLISGLRILISKFFRVIFDFYLVACHSKSPLTLTNRQMAAVVLTKMHFNPTSKQ